MTTTRLYYDDSHLVEFAATVTELTEVDGHSAVVLDRTAFYPTGGGQPHDTGTLNGVRVVDVQARSSDGAVLHLLDGESPQGEVTGRVDWPRRFHHMQHHTGQHILTQAFVQVAGAHTVGFHLGEGSITIDLDTLALSDDALHTAEDLANRIIMEDRPVEPVLIDPEGANDVRIRRTPDLETTGGRLRVVEVADFDRTACGGTHVTRTGQIGVLKILSTEKRGDATRVEFRCGGAALHDYRRKHDLLTEVSNDLTAGIEEVPTLVSKLRDDLQQAAKALEKAQATLIDYEAASLIAGTPVEDGRRTVVKVLPAGSDPRALASRLVASPHTIALIGMAGERTQVVLACSDDLDLDMRPALLTALEPLGGRGGGRPSFAQGGGGSATEEELREALLDGLRVLLSG